MRARTVYTASMIHRGLLILSILLLFSGCVGIQTQIDRSAIRDYAESLVDRYDGQGPVEVRDYLASSPDPWEDPRISLDEVTVSEGAARELHHPEGIPLLHQTVRFDSGFDSGRPLVDEAQFFLYSQYGENLDGKDAVIWLPGMGFSELALDFVEPFFHAILEAGSVLLIYIPPYHLSRLPDDSENTDLLHPDVTESLRRFAAMTGEIVTMHRWLRSRGIDRIGGWGGSIGAAVMVLAGQAVPFDHMAMMIPMVDFSTLIPLHPDMSPYVELVESDGISGDLLQRAYGTISPAYYELPVPSDRSLIMAAELDQLTPLSVIEGYARANEVDQLSVFPNSHTTILLQRDVFAAYRTWLQTLSPEG